MRNHVVVFAAAVVLAGCGGGGGGSGGHGTTLHCDFSGMCDQITAVMTADQQTQLHTNCSNGGGAFGLGICPTSGAVAGHCHYSGSIVGSTTGVTIDGAVLDQFFYTSDGWTSPDAQSFCEAPPAGIWVP